MEFDGKQLYPWAVFVFHSFYPRIETGYSFITGREEYFINQPNNRTFTKFKDKASGIFRVRHFNAKNLLFQHLPIKKDVILKEKDIKMLIGFEMDM